MEIKKTLVPIIAANCTNNKAILIHKIKNTSFIEDKFSYHYYIAEIMTYASPFFIINANS